jgi:hypothetical protein
MHAVSLQNNEKSAVCTIRYAKTHFELQEIKMKEPDWIVPLRFEAKQGTIGSGQRSLMLDI